MTFDPTLSDFVDPDSRESEFAELIAAISDRLQRGETVDPADYPGHEAELRELLPTLCMVTDLRGSPAQEMELGRLGDFRIIREVGRGGMGIVYEAIQISLDRRVALKVLPNASTLDSRQLQRFQVEAQAAASLRHPHIVPVYSSGTADGSPYYAMLFIEGRDLAWVIRERREEKAKAAARVGENGVSSRSASQGGVFAREAARIGLQAAEALEHAHACDIVHRDVKPSNLLVDESGGVWITDFGLARIAGGLDLTLTGDVVGTLRYMSPEQAAGRRGPYDGRTDVYSLGATLYELLTLQPVFDGGDRVDVMGRIVAAEPIPPRYIDPTIPVDLETILLKAMAKAPADRYATAGALAADLGRFLDGLPIRARRPTWADRAVKWMRRRRRLVAYTAAGLILLAVVSAVAGGRYTYWLREHNRSLEEAVARADRNAQEAHRQRRIAERHAYVVGIRLAGQAVEDRQWERAQELLEEIEASSADDSRGFCWGYLRRVARRDIVLLPGRAVPTAEIALTRDGKTLLSRGADHVLTRWGFPPHRPLAVVGPFEVFRVSFSPDGLSLAGDCFTPDRSIRRHLDLRSAVDGASRAVFPSEASVDNSTYYEYGFIKNGGMLQCAWLNSTMPPPLSMSARIWDLSDLPAEPKPRVALDGLAHAAFAPVGDRFATMENQGVFVRDVSTGDVRLKLSGRPDSTMKSMLSSDGRWLAVHHTDGLVVVFEVETGTERQRCQFAEPISRLLFNPQGDVLAAATDSAAVFLWNLDSGESLKLQTVDPDDTKGLWKWCFSPDGKRLATTPEGKPQGLHPTIVWDVATGRRYGPPPSPEPGAEVVIFTPDSRSLIISGPRSPRIWHFDPIPDPPSPAGHKDEAWSLAYAPHGKTLATGSDDTDDSQTIKLWNPETGGLIRGWHAGEGTVSTLAFSPDGQILASGHLSPKDNVKLWEPASGRLLLTLSGHSAHVRSLEFSRDGRLLATAGRDRTLILWDPATGRIVRRLEGHSNVVREVDFSPDGRVLASVATSGELCLWDVASGLLLNKDATPSKFTGVVFSPDGSKLATCDEEGVVRLRDARSLDVIRVIRGDLEPFFDIDFASDGRSVATSSKSGAIHIWDVLTGKELLALEGHAAQVNSLAFSPDGRTLASCAHDGAVRLWRSAPDLPPAP